MKCTTKHYSGHHPNISFVIAFQYCDSPIEGWDVSSMTTMNQLFHSSVPNRDTCNPDISKWNVSNVVDFVSSSFTILRMCITYLSEINLMCLYLM